MIRNFLVALHVRKTCGKIMVKTLYAASYSSSCNGSGNSRCKHATNGANAAASTVQVKVYCFLIVKVRIQPGASCVLTILCSGRSKYMYVLREMHIFSIAMTTYSTPTFLSSSGIL